MTGRQKFALAGSLVFMGLSLFLAYEVGERIVAAYDQWLHFKDHAGGGHITLSKETATLFYAASLVCIAAAVLLARETTRIGGTVKALAWLPVAALSVAVIAFTCLALSPLSAWRP